MMTVYRINWFRGDAIGGPPKAVEIEKPHYPFRDADGVQWCNDIHFRTEREAWEALVKNLTLVHRSWDTLRAQKQSELDAVTARMLEVEGMRVEAEQVFEAWARRQ